MRKSIILTIALIASLSISAQTKEKQDSLNIPVILVDGVEVQSIDNLDQKDMKPLVQKYQEDMKKAKSDKKPGQIYIR